LTGIEGFRETKKRTNHFIAVSDAVRRNLIENHQVLPEIISLIYGFIPMEKLSDEEIRSKKRAICKELNIPENAFIVGASGTLNWRKAPEIFIQIARAVSRKKPNAPIYFLWVGGAEKGDFALFEVNFDIEKLGLQNKIFFLEQKSNPLDYYAALDVFAMVSREEPFGLVCLESAIYNTPIICFAEAGGVPEFVSDDAGFIVPYLDVEKFAEKITELYEKPQLTEKLGRKSAEKAFANHNITSSAPKIAELIDRFLVKK
jgi:glycosyltransferase involved in cell wall biosynthesis